MKYFSTYLRPMATVKIIHRVDKADGNGEAPLYLSIYAGDRSQKKLDISIHPKYWNPERQRIRKTHGNATSLNRVLDKIKGRAQIALNQVKPLTAKNVKAFLDGVNRSSFYEYTESILDDYSYHYRRGLQTLMVVMKEFRAELSFSEITSEFLRDLERHLLQGRARNTVSTYLRRISVVLGKAVREHVIRIEDNPFIGGRFHVSWQETNPTPLSPKEFRLLRDSSVPEELQLYKDLFLFAVYADGMRLTDVLRLKAANIEGGRLRYQMQKTKKPKELELVQPALEIIERYKGGSYVFPVLIDRWKGDEIPYRIEIASARINDRLKKIRNIVGLEKLHFHMARNTASLLAYEAGWNLLEIQEMLKHSSIQQTRDYIGRLSPDKLTEKRNDLFK